MNESRPPPGPDVWRGPVALPAFPEKALETPDARARWQESTISELADTVYGPIPAPPDRIEVVRRSVDDRVDLLRLTLKAGERCHDVDAMLWMPRALAAAAPVLIGLDFLGPLGTRPQPDVPLDPHAIVFAKPELGDFGGHLGETHRGATAHRWPVDLLTEAGFAVITSCYGSWVPDCPDRWKSHGLCKLLGIGSDGPETGAISLWAWALHRLVDVAERLDGTDARRCFVAGHSRLAKAALWSAATDRRIAGVFANNSGCAGAAPALHGVGETLADLNRRFPHWTIMSSAYNTRAVLDQHALLACIAPRPLYLASAEADLWSDPLGTYAAMVAASAMWTEPDQQKSQTWPHPEEAWQTAEQIVRGRLGSHIRPGGHDLLPHDWRFLLRFLGMQTSNAEPSPSERAPSS